MSYVKKSQAINCSSHICNYRWSVCICWLWLNKHEKAYNYSRTSNGNCNTNLNKRFKCLGVIVYSVFVFRRVFLRSLSRPVWSYCCSRGHCTSKTLQHCVPGATSQLRQISGWQSCQCHNVTCTCSSKWKCLYYKGEFVIPHNIFNIIIPTDIQIHQI